MVIKPCLISPQAQVVHLLLMEQCKSSDHFVYSVMAKHFLQMNLHGIKVQLSYNNIRFFWCRRRLKVKSLIQLYCYYYALTRSQNFNFHSLVKSESSNFFFQLQIFYFLSLLLGQDFHTQIEHRIIIRVEIVELLQTVIGL